MGQRPDNNVCSHAQCRLTGNLGVVVDMCILPAISQVAFVGVDDEDSFPLEEGQRLRSGAVVFMDLRQPSRKTEVAVKYLVVGRQFDEILAGIQALHLASKGLVEAVVVVGMQEATGIKIPSQALNLLIGEVDIAVPCQVEVGVGEQILVVDLHPGLLGGHTDRRVGPDETQQIRQRGWVAVPVSAPIVLHARDRESRGRDLRPGLNARRREDQQQETGKARPPFPAMAHGCKRHSQQPRGSRHR